MKVHVFKNLDEIADFDREKPQEEIFTRDGGKLVNVSITGTSLVAAVSGIVAALMKLTDSFGPEKTLYMHAGSLSSNIFESRFSLVVAVSGVADLDERVRTIQGNLLSSEQPQEESTSTEETPLQVDPSVLAE